jgi:hypothetical protein
MPVTHLVLHLIHLDMTQSLNLSGLGPVLGARTPVSSTNIGRSDPVNLLLPTTLLLAGLVARAPTTFANAVVSSTVATLPDPNHLVSPTGTAVRNPTTTSIIVIGLPSKTASSTLMASPSPSFSQKRIPRPVVPERERVQLQREAAVETVRIKATIGQPERVKDSLTPNMSPSCLPLLPPTLPTLIFHHSFKT